MLHEFPPSRALARSIHTAANLTYWLENPQWQPGSRLGDIALQALRGSHIRPHQAIRTTFFDLNKLLGIGGESVLGHDSSPANTVHKYMFRYPGNMGLETFYQSVGNEVRIMTSRLGAVALPTEVHVQTAGIFLQPYLQRTPVVTQVQPRMNLPNNPPLDLASLQNDLSCTTKDRTVADLETFIRKTSSLWEEDGMLPDIAAAGENLRVNRVDGNVTLLDIMPVYCNGSRLIGDHPPQLVPHILDRLEAIEKLVGQYGRD